MKNTIRILAACAALALTGCASVPGGDGERITVQKALDAVLPPGFSGPAHVSHRNAYFDISIDAGGLKRTEKGWTWEWLTYERNSHFPLWSSTGKISLGKTPQ